MNNEMNIEEKHTVASSTSIHVDAMQMIIAKTMIAIWILCLIVGNPYTQVVQAIWILYIAIMNFNIFVQHQKKLSLACTVIMIGYFVMEFIVLL